MMTRRIVHAVLAILFLSACSKPSDRTSQGMETEGETEIVETFVTRFTDPSQVSANLYDFLTETIGLDGVSVEYEGEDLSVSFDQPYGVQGHQLKLLYTSVLVTAQSHAPLCEQTKMTIRIDQAPFLTLISDCAAIAAYQHGELGVNELYNGMALSVPQTDIDEAAIALAEEPSPPTPTAIPTPSDQVLLEGINLLGVRLRQNVFEYWEIIGVAVNDGEYTVNGVELLLEVYNSAGELVYSDDLRLQSAYLSPGEASAFIRNLPGDVQDPAEVIVSVVDGSYDPWLLDFPALEVEGARIVPGYELGSVSIAGEIYNPHDQAVLLHHITGVAADSDGQSIAVADEGEAVIYITPGERVPFVLPFKPFTAAERTAMTDAYVYLEALFTEERNPLPIHFVEGVRHYYDADGQSHIIGMLWNEGEIPVMVELVGTLRDDQGAVIDNATDSPPFFYVPPKAVLPFDINNWNVDRDLVQENAASFEVVVDAGWEPMVDEEWGLRPIPVDLLTTETSSFSHVMGKMGAGELDLDILESMVVIASAWAGDGQSLLGVSWSSISTNADPDWELHLNIPMDVQNLDPTTVSYDMIIYGLERLDQ